MFGDFEINGLSDEMNEQNSFNSLSGLDDQIERGAALDAKIEDKPSDEKREKIGETKRPKLEVITPQKDIENAFKRQYKKVESVEKQAEIEKNTEKLESNNDLNEITEVDGSHFNDNPNRDIKEAFDYVDIMYDKDSPEWQETAVRYEDALTGKLDEISNEYNAAEEKFNEAQDKISDVISKYNLSAETCMNNQEYVDANKQYMEASDKLNSCKLEKDKIESQLEYIRPYIKPENRTIYQGFAGSDYRSSYNTFITNPQGENVENARGTCSINDAAGRYNQQTGARISESQMLDAFKAYGKCVNVDITPDMSPDKIRSVINENGGTHLSERAFMADKFGLDYSVDMGKNLSLDKMKAMMDKGYSIGLGIKGEDISQKQIAPRTRHLFGLAGLNKSDTEHNYSNHMVTVAGFSTDKNNKITGVWINDTGGFTSSNRVFISAEKFNDMSKNTLYMTAEYCKAKDIGDTNLGKAIDAPKDASEKQSLSAGKYENVATASKLDYSDLKSSYGERLHYTPKENTLSDGTPRWSEKRGESLCRSDSEEVKPYLEKAGVSGVDYSDCIPDFSPFSKGDVEIPKMSENRYGNNGNFMQADIALAEKKGCTPQDVANWREANKYTWHECNDRKTCQKIPSVINGKFGHLGGVAECKRDKAWEDNFDD